MRKGRTDHPEPSSWQQLISLWPSIKERGRRLLLWLCVLTFILFEWHIIPAAELVTHGGVARHIILSVLVVLGAGIVELLFETRESVEKVSRDIKQLEKNASTKLRSLQTSMQDLSGPLNRITSDDKLLIKHMGLNMEQAWNYLRLYFLEHKNVNNVEVRLLILPNDSSEILTHPNHPVPTDVAAWCKSVEHRLKIIDSSLKSQSSAMKKRGKHLMLQIKQYRVVPVFHGFSISGPINFCCLSFCRWKHDNDEFKDWEYDWGEFSYHTISEDNTDLGGEDLRKIYDGHFEYLWATSGDPVVSFSTVHGSDVLR